MQTFGRRHFLRGAAIIGAAGAAGTLPALAVAQEEDARAERITFRIPGLDPAHDGAEQRAGRKPHEAAIDQGAAIIGWSGHGVLTAGRAESTERGLGAGHSLFTTSAFSAVKQSAA